MVTETEFTIWGSEQAGAIARTSDFHRVKVETPFPCPPLTIPNRENTTDLS